ncbi:uncharacterized protein LOC143912916 [Arctopsyche grandis]|uniref:uncharacterized protein LOC143912916 n=1 Tax=Arctopsyche grandis TaxID=121162 RepID=UPI00406D83E7
MECRLCLLSASPECYISIHDNPHPLARRIGRCCRLQVNKDDGLSDRICLSCVKNLKFLTRFQSVCLQSDETLKRRPTEHSEIKKIERVTHGTFNTIVLTRKNLIVDVHQLMDNQQIENEKWDLFSLHDATKNIEECLQWLAKRRLIKNSCFCIQCGYYTSLSKFAQTNDGFRWVCTRCNFRKSIRSESFFFQSGNPFRKILLLIYLWCKDSLQTIIVDEVDVSKKTAIDWCNFCREECKKWNHRHVSEIGGIDENFEPVTVEIDEWDWYFDRKYHRGQHRQGHCVLAGIEKLKDGNVGKCFSVVVPNRSADTLQKEILRHILPGSNIISKSGAAYDNIPHIANGIYTHSFLDSNDSELHTQNFENMWLQAKRKLTHQCGTNHKLFATYLDEFVFRNRFRSSTNLFGVFLTVIGENYAL